MVTAPVETENFTPEFFLHASLNGSVFDPVLTGLSKDWRKRSQSLPLSQLANPCRNAMGFGGLDRVSSHSLMIEIYSGTAT